MTESNAKRLMGYSFLVVFANNRTIDPGELAMLERLALEDREVDDHERHILSQIFGRVTAADTTPEVWADIQQFKTRHAIP